MSKMISTSSLVCVLSTTLLLSVGVSGWSPELPPLSRRQAFNQVITTSSVTAAIVIGATTASVVLPQPAYAGVAGDNEPRITNRMGGLLESYQDGPRGFRIMAPSGWNKFEGEVGAFDVKWQDLVEPTENIKISSTPVKSTTESIDVLGPVGELGIKLASKRNAKVVAATERTTEGILFYNFDFAINDGTHQLLVLCVAKGKLWSLDCNAKEKRWSKRSEMYKNVAGSFVPRLNAV